ncbi:general secretion pathway protein D [Sporomusaceae bacterium BoRhaA]|uniref:type II secretion system protein GspD n=1 Tax=Pelorhabdus rhamnosifermentans TaxID=2772457 RepID=UPI001C0642D6|nr:secretin N-terminal domain-containing protein [Pelorhabdus rhamnosifermentans]MBU2700967.1 general secretion pathway protein D [Pelorhabdus rhamnosifermentans]
MRISRRKMISVTILAVLLLFNMSLLAFAEESNDAVQNASPFPPNAAVPQGGQAPAISGANQNLPQNTVLPNANSYISLAHPLVIQLKYVKPDQVKTLISSLIPADRLKVDFINNKLVAVGDEDDYDTVKEIISQIDIPPQQIMFEAEAIEISRDDYKDLGVDWGATTALPSIPPNNTLAAVPLEGSQYRVGLGKYGVNFAATLNHLLENKKARLLASPRIAALDGQTAQILIGDKLAVESHQVSNGTESISVTYVDVGIKLEVTPTVNDDGTITAHIKPEVSNKTNETKNGNPNIRTRQAETTLRVKDGETIVIGGLIQRQDTSDVVKTPLLGDLPIIGSLFRSSDREKHETELIILITPKKVGP